MKIFVFAISLFASQCVCHRTGARIRRRAFNAGQRCQQSTDDKIKALEERVIALEGQLRILQSKQQPVEPVTNAAAAAPTTQAAAAEQAQTAVANTQQPVMAAQPDKPRRSIPTSA